MSYRQQHLEASLKREISRVLTEGLNDPRIRGIITVASFENNPVTGRARVGISVMPAEGAALCLHGLKSAAGHVRSLVGKSLKARYIPHLDFFIDDSIRKESDIQSAIFQAMEQESELALRREKEKESQDEGAKSRAWEIDEDKI